MNKLINWLKKSGAVISNNLYIKENNNNRSIYSKNKIFKNTNIIKIPKYLIITDKMGENTIYSKEITINKLYQIKNNKILLILFFILSELVKKNSLFNNYFNILPLNINNFPIFWTFANLTYLENSLFKKEIYNRSRDFNYMFNLLVKLSPTFKEHCNINLFLRLRTLIGSRNFNLNIDGNDCLCMVPLGDMLNHSFKPTVKWYYKNGYFIMNTYSNINKNVEITDSYGFKSNNRYLLYYGFCLKNNPYNTIRFQVIYNNQLKYDNYISKNINSPNIKQLFDVLRNNNKITFQSEIDVLQLFKYYIKQYKLRYSNSLKDNIKDLHKYKKHSNNYCAILIVIGEKKILNFYLKNIEYILKLANNPVINKKTIKVVLKLNTTINNDIKNYIKYLYRL